MYTAQGAKWGLFGDYSGEQSPELVKGYEKVMYQKPCIINDYRSA